MPPQLPAGSTKLSKARFPRRVMRCCLLAIDIVSEILSATTKRALLCDNRVWILLQGQMGVTPHLLATAERAFVIPPAPSTGKQRGSRADDDPSRSTPLLTQAGSGTLVRNPMWIPPFEPFSVRYRSDRSPHSRCSWLTPLQLQGHKDNDSDRPSADAGCCMVCCICPRPALRRGLRRVMRRCETWGKVGACVANIISDSVTNPLIPLSSPWVAHTSTLPCKQRVADFFGHASGKKPFESARC